MKSVMAELTGTRVGAFRIRLGQVIAGARSSQRARLKIANFAFVILLAIVAGPGIAEAQQTPAVITPPEMATDPNDLNLLTGMAMSKRPEVSIPAAPRLTYTRPSDFMMYVDGQRNVGTRNGKWAVHFGGPRSENFQCQDADCTLKKNSHSQFFPQARGPSSYVQAKTGASYLFNILSYNYVDNYSGFNNTEYYASRISYPDGEVLTIQYDQYDPNQSASGKRLAKVQTNVGYYLELKYWDSLGPDYWFIVKTATIYSNSDPATPLSQVSYSSDGNQETDLSGRTWACADCGHYAFVSPWRSADSLTLPGESSPSLTYTADTTNNFLATTINKDGVSWNYSYGGLAIEHSAFSTTDMVSYAYNSIGVTGPNGYQRTYGIHSVDWGNPMPAPGPRYEIQYVSSSTDELNRTTSFTYPSAAPFDLLSITYPEGNSSTFTYDFYGNITSKTDKAKPGSGLPDLSQQADYTTGCTTTMCLAPVWYRDTLGRQTDFTSNAYAQITSRTDPANAQGIRLKTTYDYQTVDTGAGLISRNVTVRTCGVGTTCGVSDETRVEYQYFGNTFLHSLERHIDPATGAIRDTTFVYDSAGRVLSVDGPLAGTADAQFFRYDVAGRKTWEIGALAPNGLRIAKRTHYRAADDKPDYVETGTLVSETDTNLQVFARVDYAFDSKRNPVRETQSAGGTTLAVTDRSFLDRGLPECTTARMNPATWSALPASACTLATTSTTYGPDRITKNIYDNAGQLLKVVKAFGQTSANGLPQLQQDYSTSTYTSNSKQKTLKDANGNLTTYTYDGYDRLAAWAFPSKTATGASAPCTIGTIAEATDTFGVAVTGPTETRTAGDDCEKYAYDRNGNRAKLMKRDGNVIRYAFDALNRVTHKGGTAVADVDYTYDLTGHQLTATYSTGGKGITNIYDGFGELINTTNNMGATARTLNYQYDVAGNRSQLTYPDTSYFTYAYDALNRLATIKEAGTTAIVSTTYDAQGRVGGQTRGAVTTTLGYDLLSRPTSWVDDLSGTTSDVTSTFAYNPASQIVTKTRSNDAYRFTGYVSVSRPYVVNGLNQYTAGGSAAFTYDDNGNLTSDGTNTYTYDVENRMKTATVGGLANTLTYDPLGRLWQVVTPTKTIEWTYDGDSLVMETDGTTSTRYVHGPNDDDPMIQYNGTGYGTRYSLHPDYQGSIVSTADATGAKFAINTYDEYGITPTSNVGRFQYTGQAWIGQLGLYYYKARMYSPTMGRFMQTDPIGYKDQNNLYAYVGNDPIDMRDPPGTGPEDVWESAKAWASDEWNNLETQFHRIPSDINTFPEHFWNGTTGLPPTVSGGANVIMAPVSLLNAFRMSTVRATPAFVERGGYIINQIRTQFNRPGTTGLADAIRRQLTTGELVGGKDHLVKGRGAVKWATRQIKQIYSDRDLLQTEKDRLTSTLTKFKNEISGALAK